MNKYSVVSFVIGAVFIVIAVLISNLIPCMQITSTIKIIIYIVMISPWLSFIAFMLMSMSKVTKI